MIIRALTFFLLTAPALALASDAHTAVSGCQEEDYVFADSQASIAIDGSGYTPRCLKVRVGSLVTISASSRHPLAPQDQEQNPIPESATTVTIEFQKPGVFGYFCVAHGNAQGEGMAGSVLVVEEL